jgi:hypothetical protein
LDGWAITAVCIYKIIYFWGGVNGGGNILGVRGLKRLKSAENVSERVENGGKEAVRDWIFAENGGFGGVGGGAK